MTAPVVLSLCDYTGVWSRPYVQAGYEVVQVDIKRGQDIRLFSHLKRPVRGVLAAPPCTHFANSGARWWEVKGEQALLEGLGLVDACLRVIATHDPVWWVLENPVGRLTRYLGPPAAAFDPYEYGGWPGGENDNYTKRTLLWGRFMMPEKCPIPPSDGSRMHRLPPSADRQALRSVTPAGFALAFFTANL